MNEKKFTFIICTNDDSKYDEAEYYISHLDVPAGYEGEVIKIEEAKSVFAGYNQGMNSSNAKYKIYMHHDVKIINRDFLYDILRIFSDPEVGLIGIVGARELKSLPWHWDAGAIIETRACFTDEGRFTDSTTDIYVAEVDGALMATQYDLPWREDIFSGWDMYDRSQCTEFIKAGKKIVVPYQERSWCIHDCGFPSLDQYLDNLSAFHREYEQYINYL